MLRNRLLPVVRLVSPLLAVSLLLPASASAQEALQIGSVAPPEGPLPQPVPGQTPTTTQTQGPGVQSQLSPGGPQTQSQVQPLAGGPLPMNPGSINMQPQIQVLVQPQIQISAQPKGDASPTTNADATVNTNTTPTITNTTTESIVARPYTPPQTYNPPPQVYAPPTAPPPQVITRVISMPQPAAYKPYKELKPIPRRKGLMITGWIILTISYALTASNAADLWDRCPGMSDPKRCRDLSRDMFIPVAGPFMAMQHTKWATDDYSLAVSGSLQSAGALMGIIGTAMFIRDGRRNRFINEYGVRVGNDHVRLRSTGTGLTLRAQF
jgi:hypothetical protein